MVNDQSVVGECPEDGFRRGPALFDRRVLGNALWVSLWFTGQKDAGLFVGIWVPSILSFRVYLKCPGRNR